MGALVQDLRYALRMLVRNRGFTAVAVLTLALGIGPNTAIFSLVNAALLRPLPYKDPDQLVMVWEQLKKLGINRFAAPLANYMDYRAENQVFQDIAAFEYAHFDATTGDQPERIFGMRITANLFPLLGIEAALGRTFVSEESAPGRDAVVVLSNARWQRRFGADRGVVGKRLLLDGRLFTVIGVMPRSFRFSVGGSDLPDVWVPMVIHPDPNRSQGRLQLIGRLKPGVSVDQASASMKTVAARLEGEYHLYRGPHGEDPGYDVAVVPLRQNLTGDARESLLVMLGAVGFVLLTACANVASLLLARATSRQREIAVRAALGANRPRLIRQVLTESLLLSLIAGGLGLVLAIWGIRILVAGSPYPVLGLLNTDLDGSVLVFTLGVSILTALIFGLAPAVQRTKINLSEAMKESARSSGASRSHRRFQQGLVVVEVALSLVLVIGAALLIRSFLSLQRVNLGFIAEKVMTAQLSLPPFEYRENYQVAAFFQQLLDRVASLPSVKFSGIVSSLPLSGGAGRDPFSIEGRPWRLSGANRIPQVADYQAAGPGYFRAMQIPLLQGRDFTPGDTQGTAPVAIINETLVRGFWPGENPIGKHLMIGAPRPGAPWLTVVGVVADVRSAGPELTPIPQIYASHLQNPLRSMTLVVRSVSDPKVVISAVRSEVLALDRNLPVYGVSTMEQVLSDSLSPRRYTLVLLGTFAVLSLVLAAVGLYGAISYWVAQRTHEIGVRMALGARRGDVLRLVLRQAMILTAIGVGGGLVGALAVTRVLSSLLFGVKPTDPATFVAVPILLTGVALLASYIPARRATKVDPIVALRYE